MSMQQTWERVKEEVQRSHVTAKYVSNVLGIEEDMAECLMNDWMKLLEYEVNKELLLMTESEE